MAPLGPDSVVVASSRQVSCDLDGDTALLHVETGTYYTLDEVGTFVWQRLAEPRRVRDLVTAVVAEYEVEADVAERDLVVLLDELATEGLVEVTDGAAR